MIHIKKIRRKKNKNITVSWESHRCCWGDSLGSSLADLLPAGGVHGSALHLIHKVTVVRRTLQFHQDDINLNILSLLHLVTWGHCFHWCQPSNVTLKGNSFLNLKIKWSSNFQQLWLLSHLAHVCTFNIAAYCFPYSEDDRNFLNFNQYPDVRYCSKLLRSDQLQYFLPHFSQLFHCKLVSWLCMLSGYILVT